MYFVQISPKLLFYMVKINELYYLSLFFRLVFVIIAVLAFGGFFFFTHFRSLSLEFTKALLLFHYWLSHLRSRRRRTCKFIALNRRAINWRLETWGTESLLTLNSWRIAFTLALLISWLSWRRNYFWTLLPWSIKTLGSFNSCTLAINSRLNALYNWIGST